MALFAMAWPCVAGNKFKTKAKHPKATYGAVKAPKAPKNPGPAHVKNVKRPKRQSH